MCVWRRFRKCNFQLENEEGVLAGGLLQDVRSDPQSRLPRARPERGVTVLTLGAPSPSKRRLLEPGVALRDVMVSGLAALAL